MYEYYLIRGTTLTDIANSIRPKTGKIVQIDAANMASEIDGISSSDGTNLIPLIERTITDFELPAGLTSIENQTFYNCSGITISSLPSGITKIGDNALRSCTGITISSIPTNVTINYNYTG